MVTDVSILLARYPQDTQPNKALYLVSVMAYCLKAHLWVFFLGLSEGRPFCVRLLAAIKGSHLLNWLRKKLSPVTSGNSLVRRICLDGSQDCNN